MLWKLRGGKRKASFFLWKTPNRKWSWTWECEVVIKRDERWAGSGSSSTTYFSFRYSLQWQPRSCLFLFFFLFFFPFYVCTYGTLKFLSQEWNQSCICNLPLLQLSAMSDPSPTEWARDPIRILTETMSSPEPTEPRWELWDLYCCNYSSTTVFPY